MTSAAVTAAAQNSQLYSVKAGMSEKYSHGFYGHTGLNRKTISK